MHRLCLGLAGAGLRAGVKGCPGWDGVRDGDLEWEQRGPRSGATGRHSPTSRLGDFCVGLLVWEH